MNVSMQSTKRAKWTTRMWRTLAALDEAIGIITERLCDGCKCRFALCLVTHVRSGRCGPHAETPNLISGRLCVPFRILVDDAKSASSAASTRAIARPMPPAPPVTSATFPLSLPIIVLPMLHDLAASTTASERCCSNLVERGRSRQPLCEHRWVGRLARGQQATCDKRQAEVPSAPQSRKGVRGPMLPFEVSYSSLLKS